jgi:peptidoglycan/LPS O-acetylase OafA/YrhL
MQSNAPVRAWANPRLAGRIPELDGVRGLAIFLVLIWHYWETLTSPAPGTIVFRVHEALFLSWGGVDLFFVLSGFLIGGILLDGRESSNYFSTFYLRRVHRIFPVYFLWLGLFVIGVMAAAPLHLLPLDDIFNRRIPLWSYPLFLQNVYMAHRQQWGGRWMTITWSLAVEEQFYLLLPIAIRFLRLRMVTALTVAAIATAPLLRLGLAQTGNIYYGPYTLLPCRADALGFGVLIAIVARNEKAWDWLETHRGKLYGALVLLGLGCVYFSVRQRFVYTLGLTWIDAFCAVVLLLALVRPGRMERLAFQAPPLVRLGTIAYSVYLLHQGVNSLLFLAIFKGEPLITGYRTLATPALSLAVVVALASASWVLIERPLIRRARAKYRYLVETKERAGGQWALPVVSWRISTARPVVE